jgi:hypothetical protein
MVLRYGESNPVIAGFVNRARDWLWSSHGDAIGDRERLLVDEIPI